MHEILREKLVTGKTCA